MSDDIEFHAAQTLKGLRRSLLVLFGVAAVLAGGLVVAMLQNAATSTRVTNIEQSPCAKDVNSKECVSLRTDILRHEPLRLACIPFERVLRREPAACRNTNTGVSIPDRGPENSQEGISHEGGDASTGGNPPSQPPPSTGNGGGGNGDNGNPPSPPPSNPVQQTVDEVCSTVNNLGVTVPIVCP